jgi:hypothetical protein
MSLLMLILTLISFVGIILIAIYHYFQSKNFRNLFIHLLLIVILCVVFFCFFFPNAAVIPKGNQDDHVYLIISLYFFLVLGMLSHFCYNYLLQPLKKRKKFDFGYFIAPVLISPIVFLPLLATFQNVNLEIENLGAKLMFFCIAFENGFFWKEFFDNRYQEKERSVNDGKK